VSGPGEQIATWPSGCSTTLHGANRSRLTRRFVLLMALGRLLLGAAPASAAGRHTIGYIGNSRLTSKPWLRAFRDRLRSLGYGDDEIKIEERYTEGHFDRLPELAADLVRLAPEVIFASPPQAVKALKEATSTIPIVMTSVGDPVGLGLVASLSHPGSNVTGLSTLSEDMAGKWVELLETAAPGIRRIAFLRNPTNPAYKVVWPGAQQAALTSKVGLLAIDAREPEELEGAFAAIEREQIDGLICWGDPMLIQERSMIIDFAARRHLPAIYHFREFTADGGLMSFGPNLIDLFQRAATYVDKLLKGAKPADLPVEQPTKFELVINLKTAQALGITMPQLLLAGADEVIE
jgi:putative tryptophan/tyrosine transport system substrate-binding protein